MVPESKKLKKSSNSIECRAAEPQRFNYIILQNTTYKMHVSICALIKMSSTSGLWPVRAKERNDVLLAEYVVLREGMKKYVTQCQWRTVAGVESLAPE